jgi:hypothetical protein
VSKAEKRLEILKNAPRGTLGRKMEIIHFWTPDDEYRTARDLCRFWKE